ncbi:MAG: hypothetical protein WCC11_00895 [Gammaproteobacteria bacterium]
MSRSVHFLSVAVLGAGLVLTSSAAVANHLSGQFVVSVRVLNACRIATPELALVRGSLAVNCSRNTGYSVSLSSSTDPQTAIATLNGVGNNVTRVIPLYAWAESVAHRRLAGVVATPFMLTINY